MAAAALPAPEAGQQPAQSEREPSGRSRGSIQPHGALLVADPATWRILQASANASSVLGIDAERLLGTSAAELLGARPAARARAVLTAARGASNPIPVELSGRRFDAIVHASDGCAVLELEPALAEDAFPSVLAVLAAVERIRAARVEDELWAEAAGHLRDLTGFDRVLLLRLRDDGGGEVVAEERADDALRSLLGRRFTAAETATLGADVSADVPSSAIASIEAIPVPLEPSTNPATGRPTDLRWAELRAPDPAGLGMARTLGDAARLTFFLHLADRSIGLAVCAHAAPRRLPYRLRRSLAALAQQVGAQLGSIRELDRLARAAERLQTRSRLVEQLGPSGDLAQALLRGPTTVLDLVPASAAALRVGGTTATIGDAPDATSVARAVELLRGDRIPLPLVSDALATEHPELARLLPGIAALLAVPVDAGRGCLLWFRNEVPEPDGGAAGPGSWAGLDEAAVQLSRDLDAAVQRSGHSDLARFGFHDRLTGLPNRRVLIDRIERALAGGFGGGTVALVIVDIDSLKAVNESLGHDRGDDVLVQVAERLRSVTRASDTVARFAGDQFVVLAPSALRGSSPRIAERASAVLEAPFTVAGRSLAIAFTVGAAEADDRDTAADLVRRAASAMYRAKRSRERQEAD